MEGEVVDIVSPRPFCDKVSESRLISFVTKFKRKQIARFFHNLGAEAVSSNVSKQNQFTHPNSRLLLHHAAINHEHEGDHVRDDNGERKDVVDEGDDIVIFVRREGKSVQLEKEVFYSSVVAVLCLRQGSSARESVNVNIMNYLLRDERLQKKEPFVEIAWKRGEIIQF